MTFWIGTRAEATAVLVVARTSRLLVGRATTEAGEKRRKAVAAETRYDEKSMMGGEVWIRKA